MISCYIIWYDIILHDMILLDLIWFHIIYMMWYNTICNTIIWQNMKIKTILYEILYNQEKKKRNYCKFCWRHYLLVWLTFVWNKHLCKSIPTATCTFNSCILILHRDQSGFLGVASKVAPWKSQGIPWPRLNIIIL